MLGLRHHMQSAQSGGAIKGAAFWEWFSNGQVAPAAEGGGSGLYGIKTEDSTFGTIRQHAAAMKQCAPVPCTPTGLLQLPSFVGQCWRLAAVLSCALGH